jgi:hypothetical protein
VATKWHLGIEWPSRYWYDDPELKLTFFAPEGASYAVNVELRRDDVGPFVTGVAVRRSRFGTDWDGMSRTHVAPRDIQRLPLARIVRAALAAAATLDWAAKPISYDDLLPSESDPPDEFGWRKGRPIPGRPTIVYDRGERGDRFPVQPELQWADTARKVLVPHGRPKRGKSASFYKQLADSYRELAFTGAGASPVKEIARRKRVSENTVHQWIYRARALGFLDPSPRTKRKESTDA